MRRQGPGYRDFEKWIPSQKFSRGQNMAARFMTESLPRPVPKAAGDPHQFIFRRAFAYPSMPVTRIVELDAADASVVRPFPRQHGMQVFVYSNDHGPPHFHIKVLSNDAETRYLWPTLMPYDGNSRLTGSDAKAFEKYWQAHKRDIVSKPQKVYQSANAR